MKSISMKQLRDKLSDSIRRVNSSSEPYVLTRHGKEIAVILSQKEWQSIVSYLEQLEDEKDIREADLSYACYLKVGGVPLEEIVQKAGV